MTEKDLAYKSKREEKFRKITELMKLYKVIRPNS